MNEDNSVFIGRKPAMNYVLAVVTQFNKGSDSVIVKARGKSISRAVDVVEIVRKRFINNLEIDDIAIGTEVLTLDNKNVNVSSMEITLSKKEGIREETPEAPVDAPKETPEAPVDAPKETPEAPVDAPKEMPEAPVDTPKETPEAPVDTPKETPEAPDTPASTPETPAE